MNMVKIKAWFFLSRPFFPAVVILPFILGAVLAWHLTGRLNWAVLGCGLLGTLLIILSAHYSGEYFDYETDNLVQFQRTPFSGGSGVLQTGVIPKRQAFVASVVCLLLAAGVGLLLQFYYKTGPLTIPLGALGMFAGFFYSAKPIQWSYRGLGELWIGFSFSWLPVAASYYIQTGQISPPVHWLALPIAFTIFNVILINEFPDYFADKQVGKKTLVVRFGKEKMSKLYCLASLATWAWYFLSLAAGVPLKAILFFIPIFALSVITTLQVLRGDYKGREKLESICARTVVFNLGTTLSLILAFVL